MSETRPNHRPPKERAIDPGAELDRSFYTTAEVSELLKLHENTIRRMIRSGLLPAKKYGKQWRIKVEDLFRFTDTPNE